MLGFEQPDSMLELVNFKYSGFGMAIILTSEVSGSEVSRTWWVLKDVNGAPTQKVTSWTLIHHLRVVQQNGYVVLSQSTRWWCPDRSSQHSVDLLSCFYFCFSSLYIKISLLPSCPLYTVVFYHICHLIAELFIHGIHLIQLFLLYSRLIKAFVNRPEPRHPGVWPFVCSACKDVELDSLSVHKA